MAKHRTMTEVAGRIIRDADLSPSEKIVYLYIAAEYRAHYHNPVDCGSVSSVAADTNYSASTVRRALRRLSELELIKIVHRSPGWLNIELLHLDNGYSVLRQLASAGGA